MEDGSNEILIGRVNIVQSDRKDPSPWAKPKVLSPHHRRLPAMKTNFHPYDREFKDKHRE